MNTPPTPATNTITMIIVSLSDSFTVKYESKKMLKTHKTKTEQGTLKSRESE